MMLLTKISAARPPREATETPKNAPFVCTEMCEPAGSRPDALAGSHTAHSAPSRTEPTITATESHSSDDIDLISHQSVDEKNRPTDSPCGAFAYTTLRARPTRSASSSVTGSWGKERRASARSAAAAR